MTQEELLHKVRRIEIKARGLSRNIFAGEYHSQFKGRGIAFSEVREYQPGDDVRSIDWNVTARLNKPYVKVFEEERELTVMLLVDVSRSHYFGTLSQFKRDMMAEVAATIAFSTIQNNDKVGVLFFSDRIEKFIPAKKGKSHVLHIIRELLTIEPTSNGTDVAQALQYFTNAQKRRCTAFVLSDMMLSQPVQSIEKPLLIAANRHDVNIIQLYDSRDASLPDMGLVRFLDAESRQTMWVDTSSRRVRATYEQDWRNRQEAIRQILTKTGTNYVAVRTDEDYVKALMKLFKQ